MSVYLRRCGTCGRTEIPVGFPPGTTTKTRTIPVCRSCVDQPQPMKLPYVPEFAINPVAVCWRCHKIMWSERYATSAESYAITVDWCWCASETSLYQYLAETTRHYQTTQEHT